MIPSFWGISWTTPLEQMVLSGFILVSKMILSKAHKARVRKQLRSIRQKANKFKLLYVNNKIVELLG